MSKQRAEFNRIATEGELRKMRKYDISFWVCLIVAMGLAIAGFCVPPMGAIDGSVLTAMSIILAFYAVRCAWSAMVLGKEVRLHYHDAHIEFGDGEDMGHHHHHQQNELNNGDIHE